MNPTIEKEILLARLNYLSDIKSSQEKEDSYAKIVEVMKSMIERGEINSNMLVESVYNHLAEDAELDVNNIEVKAKEIVSFIA